MGLDCGADTDECAATATHNCALTAVCSNTPGSFTCSCKTGYTGNGIECQDIDECTDGGCLHTCANTAGSFTCGCNAGFMLNTDGRTCSDGSFQQWTRQFGTSSNDFGQGVAVDDDLKAYIVGYTNGAMHENIHLGQMDIVITKFSDAGIKEWTRQFGTSKNDYGLGIAVHDRSDVFVTGITNGELDENTNAGGLDIFVSKYNATGFKQWTRQLGTTSDDYGRGIAVDVNGNVYVTGETRGSFDGNANAGSSDIFIVKYNSEGAKQWIRQFGTASAENAVAIAISGNGAIYVTGSTRGALDGVNLGELDIVIAKYSNVGVKEWIRQLGTINDDAGSDIAVDEHNGIYVTGYTGGELHGGINAGGVDVFIVKFNSTGIKQWTRQLGTSSYDSGRGIAVDHSDSIYVTGDTEGDLDGNQNTGSSDVFIAKYSGEGVKQWMRQFGSSTLDSSRGVAVGKSGGAYVTGFTHGGLDGNSNAGQAYSSPSTHSTLLCRFYQFTIHVPRN